MKTLRTILTIIFALGGMMVFNESETIIPNLVGLACWAVVIALNADKATIEKIQK
jgi:cell shape-determining protein MreD